MSLAVCRDRRFTGTVTFWHDRLCRGGETPIQPPSASRAQPFRSPSRGKLRNELNLALTAPKQILDGPGKLRVKRFARFRLNVKTLQSAVFDVPDPRLGVPGSLYSDVGHL